MVAAAADGFCSPSVGGLQVITACTYYGTGTKLVDGLYNMSWAPYALMMSAVHE